MHIKIEHQGKEKKYSFPDKNLIQIGRAPENDVQLVLDGVSRFHFKIFLRDGVMNEPFSRPTDFYPFMA